MKILVVLPRFPYPLNKGDKLRAYHQIRCLSQNNDVYLFCITHEKVPQKDFDEVSKFCKKISIANCSKLATACGVAKSFCSMQSLQTGYWGTRNARKKYTAFEKQVQPDVIFCQMIRVMKLVKKSQYPKVLDFQDALSKNVERRMMTSHGLWKHVLHYEFKMLRSCEYNAFDIFDQMTIISNSDKEAIPHLNNQNIAVLPNGIDTNFFKPMELEKKYDVVFCGNMHYVPNVDAANFLIKEIMPIVWKKHPEVKVLISGTTPHKSVKKLACDKVTVSGWVEDIRESYAKSKIFVAPMRLGSGLQNKLLEAMAMQIPCITTTIANNSLGAETNKEILVSDTAEDLAENIIQLLDNKELKDTIASNGFNYVTQNFSWESNNTKILQTILQKATKKETI